jgi:hypothetical protein
MEDGEKRWRKEAKHEVFYYFDFSPEEHVGLFKDQDLTLIDEANALPLEEKELRQKREGLYVHYRDMAKAKMESDQTPVFIADGDE